MKKILVVGESCRDIFCYGTANRLCPDAPAPVFNFFEQIENPGMAMNVYNNILAIGHDVEIYTNMNWEDITKTRFIEYNANHMFMRYDINDNMYERCDIEKIDYEKYEAIVISDYNKGFLSNEDIEQVGLNHDCVFLDTKKKLQSWVDSITFIKINDFEYGRNRDFIITNKMENKVIVTLGSDGAEFNSVRYGVPKVGIRDVAGAGDSFIAGLVTKYTQTTDIVKAIEFANQCATKVVQKRGVSTI